MFNFTLASAEGFVSPSGVPLHQATEFLSRFRLPWGHYKKTAPTLADTHSANTRFPNSK